ncbi:MAG: hypothetical protein Kow0020_06830 [Wenzhouxiangellaceae bacterium]
MIYRLKGASGALTGTSFELRPETRIGSAAACEIVIDGLAPEHARIVVDDDGVTLEALAQCELNGESVSRARLQSGDEIRLGGVRLLLQAPGLKPQRVLEDLPEPRSRGWRRAAWAVVLIAAAAAGGWWWLQGGLS